MANPHPPMPRKTVTKQRQDTSHGMHLFLTIITGGVWGLVWLGMTVWHKMGPRKRVVTKYK
jgi:hypothetical protein